MKIPKEITYLDNGATTMVDPEVLKIMKPYLEEKYGNSSSIHTKGQEAKIALENSREIIAEAINAEPEEIIFTSGGTESNNIALKAVAFANRDKGNHIIITKIEHDCVLNAAKWLETQGFKVTLLEVDSEGFVNPKTLEKAITKQTVLVSVIHGNNEIGTIQDLEALGKVCKKHGAYFHTDACQSFTKTEIDVKKIPVDLITLNAHKIHGPKGVGVLYIRKGTKIDAWQHGGGHERNLRSGTENIPGIVGFASAVKLAMKKDYCKGMEKLRDRLIEGALKIPDSMLNGPRNRRLCNNANVAFMFVEGESIAALLDAEGICVSTGSACSSHSLEPSHVLMALGRKEEEAHGSIRFTLSRFTTEEEIERTLKVLPGIIEKLRKISPLAE